MEQKSHREFGLASVCHLPRGLLFLLEILKLYSMKGVKSAPLVKRGRASERGREGEGEREREREGGGERRKRASGKSPTERKEADR